LGVLNSWKKQYPEEKNKTTKKLELLDLSKCSEKEVVNTIGNYSWTNLDCSICGKNTNKIIELKEKKDVECQYQQ